MNRFLCCILFAAAALLMFPTRASAQLLELPVRGDDLEVGERFTTFVHAPGVQAEGKDIGVLYRNSDSDWDSLRFPFISAKILTNWRSYGKPFFAMAPGTVIACWRNAPENTPGSMLPEVTAELIPGGGNHLWVQQDDGVFVLYAHAQPGSIPESLCPHDGTLLPDSSLVGSAPSVRKWAAVTNGAHFTTGQFLGRIGNSGSSGQGPHLHVHMEKNDAPVVMKFAHGMSLFFGAGFASLAGPWQKLNGSALPAMPILVWPPHSHGSWTFAGTPGSEFQALFDHMQDSREMPDTITCKSNGASYESNWVPSKGAWVARFGMDPLQAMELNLTFLGLGFKRTSSYTCGSRSVAVWRK